MRNMTLKLTGTNILLTANDRMANPADEYALKYQAHLLLKPNMRTKKVRENKEKTPLEQMEEWLQEEKRIQFWGLIYYDEALGFKIPSDNLLYMMREAFFGYGSTSKGADRLLSILRTDKEAYSFDFAGPKTPQERFDAGLYREDTVPNQALRGARARVLQPLFKDWSVTFEVSWAMEAEKKDFLGKGRNFTPAALFDHIVAQGHTFGLGAFRKSGNYGNFEVEVVDE